ncbi:MAG: putative lipoprotein [Deltaproteobacteria bacterium]|nr:putative lipoprotein [Deltaproteobacteria bacterium]
MQHAIKSTIALLSILALMAGCSFSYSSGTSSDSSKSSSASSGGSETDPKDAKRTYMSDVSTYTTSAAKGDDAQAYLREVGSIAERNGITDWERDTATYNAIGTGLRRAGISRDEVKSVYFISALAAKEKNALVLILESYQP